MEITRRPGGPDSACFLDTAPGLLDLPGVTSSTMMGLPCLRLDGTFFAAFDSRTGDLLLKLDRAEVDRLVEAGQGHPFAPAGRRFREWVAIPSARSTEWQGLITQALEYALSRVAHTRGD